MAQQAAPRLLGFLVLLLSCPGGPLVRAAAASAENKPPGPALPPGVKCRLTGTWVNDLGSRMAISEVDDGGQFTGSYLTAVTSSENPIVKSPLHGVQDHPSSRAQPTFGFTVLWGFSDSATVFVGQCFVDEQGEEVLETSWLLRSAVETRADDWKATRVGRNVFRRKRSPGGP